MRHSLSRTVSFGLLAVLLAAAPAAAQQAAPTPGAAPAAAVQPPSASEMQVARDLVQANGEAHAFVGVISNLLDGAAIGFLQGNPDLAPQLRDVALALRPEFEKRQNEIVDILATSYADRFTETELTQALAFFKSPVGQKLVQDRPAIVQQAVQNIQVWGAKVNGEAMERIRTEMKKRGYDL